MLVFADTTCEPVSHFLALGRVAPIQAAFWGTPITTGECFPRTCEKPILSSNLLPFKISLAQSPMSRS